MKEIFADNGKIDRIEDRYSNKIKFNFYYDDTYCITDSMGREIRITKYERDNVKEIRIDVPGKGTITYIFEKNPEYKNFILTRKIDFLGRITEFCYRYDIAHTYEDIGARHRIEITNVYAHLEKIVHPNQSYTLNTYEIATKAAGNDGKKDEYYRVKSKERKRTIACTLKKSPGLQAKTYLSSTFLTLHFSGRAFDHDNLT